MEFHPSKTFSVGMEMEFQLVDPITQDLVDGILPLMEIYPDDTHIKPEFIQNTVEVASPPSHNLSELSESMSPLIRDLLRNCDRLGMRVCGAGTHPFYRRPALITPAPRYERMEKAAGWLGHNQVTFATHVHLGLPSGDEAVMQMRELKPYLPLFIALSANSPFWHGKDTRFAAFRHRVLAAARTYGAPPDFANWSEFQRFMKTMQRAQMLKTIHDIHWDIRPRPHLGTLEVRVMDAQSTLARALALAAMLRALSRFLQQTRGEDQAKRTLSPLLWWSLKDNCYTASRLGIEAKLIASEDGDVLPLLDAALCTLALIEPLAEPDERPHLKRLVRDVENGLPYVRQRRLFHETQSLNAVVQSLAGELYTENMQPSCR